MLFKRMCKLFKSGSVAIFGACGSGKDLLMSNVACRDKAGYISNVDYGGLYTPLDIRNINIPNDYHSFIESEITPYDYPYTERQNIYISDINVIFPSDYDSKLVREYPGIPSFWQLHRHLADNHIIFNTQNLDRVWKKIREHSEYYIMCRRCYVICGKLVIQHIRVYDKWQSAMDKVLPFRFPIRMKSKDLRKLVDIEKAKYINQYGIIKNRLLVYINKSKYDSRFYKTLLASRKELICND